MKAGHSSGTPGTRQRPTLDAVMLKRFPSVHEQGSRELIGRPFDAAPKRGVRPHPGVVPQVQGPVSDGVRDHPPLPRRAETLGSSHKIAGLHLLEHVRRPPSPSRPGRLAAVSSSTWPCRPSSRPTCAPLFCALVIPGDLFARPSANRLFSFTRVCSAARLGRPLPDPSRSDASPASQRCHEGCIRSVPQERHPIRRVPSQWAFNEWMRRSILPFPYGDAIGER